MRYVSMIALSMLILAGCSGGEQAETEMPEAAEKVAQGESISVDAMKNWQFLGTGSLELVASEGALRMSETEGTVGVTLVSPKSYGKNVTISFKVKPESYESVNVVFLSAADVATGGDIVVPTDYAGGFNFWTAENVQDYVIAFNNGAHNRFPFILKCPGSENMGEAEKNVTKLDWNDVEIGRENGKVWLKMNGALVIEGTDAGAESLPGGKIGFRLRGTPDSLASALYKDLVITEK